MKTRAKQMATQAIVAALTASLAPVPAANATPIIPVVEEHQNIQMVSHLTFDLTERIFFLPLPEATLYLQGITGYIRRLLSDAVSAWDLRGGKGRLFAREAVLRKSLTETITHSQKIMEAIKTIMAEEYLQKQFPDQGVREEYKSSLMQFGRAVANNRYTAEDVLTHIEQVKSPRATINAVQPDATEVRAMIAAEHKSLGLNNPKWL